MSSSDPQTNGNPMFTRQNKIMALIGAVAFMVIMILLPLWRSAPEPAAPPTPVVTPTVEIETSQPEQLPPAPSITVNEAPATPDEPPLPSLDNSDDYAQSLAAPLNEELDGVWPYGDELIRKHTLVVSNLAMGKLVNKHLPFQYSPGKFTPRQVGEQYWMGESNYQRYDALVERVVAIEPESLAAVYQRLQPLFQEAYAELGYGNRPFEQAISDTLEVLLETPEVEGEIELTRPSVLYKFADSELESLPAVQKQLLRMGPENIRQLKPWLEELRSTLR